MTNVVVVGAGKMGLPLACQFADRGAQVTACDVNPDLVAAINAGTCPFDEPGLAPLLASAWEQGSLRATTDTARAAAQADVVIVIVPAILTETRDVDTRALESVADILGRSIRSGTMVSFETTMPVGGTRRVLLPHLESQGLVAGKDFDLVFSPERVKSKFVLRNLTVNPKVVGGATPEAAERAAEFYATYLGAPVMNVGTLEAAEMVKLAGMVYRDVNIALANELAGYAEAVGVDLSLLSEAINSDGEAALLTPGIGVGGHCTPVYPYFLLRDAERRGLHVPLIDRARRTNDEQAARAVERLAAVLDGVGGRKVRILGLAFRPGVREHTCSTAFLLREELERRGAHVTLHDPLYTADELREHGFEPADLYDPCDALVLNTAHPEFGALDLEAIAAAGVQVVVDGRNFLPQQEVARAGLVYLGIGRPGPESPAPALPLAVPTLLHDEADAAAQVVRSGWVMQGPEVAQFEREFAAFTGAPHACAVSSGTAALHLTLLALGIGAGDEVITVSHSFIATANSVRLCGATPVFVDVEPGGFNMDPTRVTEAITQRTKAILAVHQFGMPCDLEALTAIAEAHDLPLVEDAACAAGSQVLAAGEWSRIGKPHGVAATFSFHPRKVLTTGDGGLVTTADSSLAERIRLLREHGTSDGKTWSLVGFNYRLTDIQAAVGRRQLARLPELVEHRRTLAAHYDEVLSGIPGLALPAEPEWTRSNVQTYCVMLPASVDSNEVVALLGQLGVSARPGIPNAHAQPAYADYELRHPLPESERASARGLCLPVHGAMGVADVDRVAAALQEALRQPGGTAPTREGELR